jgi:hypothetical protein
MGKLAIWADFASSASEFCSIESGGPADIAVCVDRARSAGRNIFAKRRG